MLCRTRPLQQTAARPRPGARPAPPAAPRARDRRARRPPPPAPLCRPACFGTPSSGHTLMVMHKCTDSQRAPQLLRASPSHPQQHARTRGPASGRRPAFACAGPARQSRGAQSTCGTLKKAGRSQGQDARTHQTPDDLQAPAPPHQRCARGRLRRHALRRRGATRLGTDCGRPTPGRPACRASPYYSHVKSHRLSAWAVWARAVRRWAKRAGAHMGGAKGRGGGWGRSSLDLGTAPPAGSMGHVAASARRPPPWRAALACRPPPPRFVSLGLCPCTFPNGVTRQFRERGSQHRGFPRPRTSRPLGPLHGSDCCTGLHECLWCGAWHGGGRGGSFPLGFGSEEWAPAPAAWRPPAPCRVVGR